MLKIKIVAMRLGLFAMLGLSLSACLVPQDLPIVVVTSRPSANLSYGGFSGLVSAQTLSSSKVKLNWNPTSDPTVSAYIVYDSTNPFRIQQLKSIRTSLDAPVTTTTITGLTPDNLYVFRVHAVDSNGVEDTNTVDVSAVPYAGILTAVPTSGTTATLTFSDGSNADQILSYCTTDTNLDKARWTLVGSTTNVYKTSMNITGLTPGVTYSCRTHLKFGTFPEDNNTTSVSFIPIGSAASLAFSTVPSPSSVAGQPWAIMPVIQILDSSGNIVSAGVDSTAKITLTLAPSSVSTNPTFPIPTLRWANPGTVISMNASKGVADFSGSGLNIQEAGTMVLTATKDDTTSAGGSPPVPNPPRTTFTIIPDIATSNNSSITVAPDSNATLNGGLVVADGVSLYKITIVQNDQYLNPVTSQPSTISTPFYSSDSVPNFVSGTPPIPGTMIGTLSATTSGNRTLSIASIPTRTAAANFAPAISPTQLVFTLQPSSTNKIAVGDGNLGTIKVALQDAFGNLVSNPLSPVVVNLSLYNSSVPLTVGTSSTGTSVTAVNGVATFTGLSIMTPGSSYQLVATTTTYGISSALSPNKLNVTASGAAVIAIQVGPSPVPSGSPVPLTSGLCAPLVVSFKDVANNNSNPANATNVYMSGFGGSVLYTSSSNCTNGTSPKLSSSTAAGSNYVTMSVSPTTYYIKDLVGESITLSATTTLSLGSTTASQVVNVLPNYLTFVPPSSIRSGDCIPITITTNTKTTATPPVITPANVYSNTTINLMSGASPAVLGLPVGTSAKYYANSTNCTNKTSPITSITVPANSSTATVYLSDSKSETLSALFVADGSTTSATTTFMTSSNAQTVSVLASKIVFTGPTTVLAGACIPAGNLFSTTLKDANDNAVPVPASLPAGQDLTLTITGGGSQAGFYTSSDCSGTSIGGSGATVNIPVGSSNASFSFMDPVAELVSISVSDPSSNTSLRLNPPSAISMNVTPSKLTLTPNTTPSPTASPIVQANTNSCAGPFTLAARDANNTAPTSVSPTINVSLTGSDVASSFYSDLGCSQLISAPIPISTSNPQNIYFKALYPGVYNLGASSGTAGVANAPTVSYTVLPAPAYIGGAATSQSGGVFQGFPNPAPTAPGYTMGTYPVTPLVDGMQGGGQFLHFDSTRTYLYVVDQNYGRILKYNYKTNPMTLIGWIGYISSGPLSGSGVDTDPNGTNHSTNMAASCQGAQAGTVTPGWCLGGQSASNSSLAASGAMNFPSAITDDGNFIYVANNVTGGIPLLRYNAVTGAFAGWTGASLTGSPTNPSDIPTSTYNCATSATGSGTAVGWCMGGTGFTAGWFWGYGGLMYGSIGAIANDGTYLYASDSAAIYRFLLSTGNQAGWIGNVNTNTGLYQTAPCNAYPTAYAWRNNGWCNQGSPGNSNNGSNAQPPFSGIGGLFVDRNINALFAITNFNLGSILKFQLDTGSTQGVLIGGTNNSSTTPLISPRAMISDGTYYYIADSTRVAKVQRTGSSLATYGGTVISWIGKMSGLPSPDSGACATFPSLVGANLNTPGWCYGPSGSNMVTLNIAGKDEGAFHNLQAIEYDGKSLLTAERDVGNASNIYEYYNRIQKFDAAQGFYQGFAGWVSSAPSKWVADTTPAQLPPGFDDNSFGVPKGITSDGTYLYVVDSWNARIKKILKSTGATVGWIGGNLGIPSAASPDSSCNFNVAAAFTLNPGWCLGGLAQSMLSQLTWWNNPIPPWVNSGSQSPQTGNNMLVSPFTTPGVMSMPWGITNDGTYLYVTDYFQSKLLRYNMTSGAYGGWSGSGCSTGWCTSGLSNTSASGTTSLASPEGIAYYNGNLYVAEHGSMRVSVWNAATGLSTGWMGNSGSGSGNATGFSLLNATSSSGTGPGTFNFDTYQNIGVAVDTTSNVIYVSNASSGRIEALQLTSGTRSGLNSSGGAITNATFNSGQYVDALNTNQNSSPTATFTQYASNNGDLSITNPRVQGVYSDGSYLYVAVIDNPGGGSPFGNAGNFKGPGYIQKRNLHGNNAGQGGGAIVGWRGAIDPAHVPTTGVCQGKIGQAPGWCTVGANYTISGLPIQSTSMSGFSSPAYITGDANYIYVTDSYNNRVVRLPK